jgi:hypothetical protein
MELNRSLRFSARMAQIHHIAAGAAILTLKRDH